VVAGTYICIIPVCTEIILSYEKQSHLFTTVYPFRTAAMKMVTTQNFQAH